MEIELTKLNSLTIYQPKDGYRFSSEPFILMKDIKLKDDFIFLDFGSGCGIIPILASKINNNCLIYALEKNLDMADLIRKNIEINKTENIRIVDGLQYVKTNSVDIVVSNPPYFVKGFYRKSRKFYSEKFESSSLDEMLRDIRRIIKNKGLLKISYHPSRFAELIQKLEKFGFGVKSIIPVYGNSENDASFIVVESKFNTKSHVVFKKAIYLEDFQYF